MRPAGRRPGAQIQDSAHAKAGIWFQYNAAEEQGRTELLPINNVANWRGTGPRQLRVRYSHRAAAIARAISLRQFTMGRLSKSAKTNYQIFSSTRHVSRQRFGVAAPEEVLSSHLRLI